MPTTLIGDSVSVSTQGQNAGEYLGVDAASIERTGESPPLQLTSSPLVQATQVSPGYSKDKVPGSSSGPFQN